MIRFGKNNDECKIQDLEFLLRMAKDEYTSLLDGELHLALFSQYTLTFFAIDQFIDQLKVYESEYQRGNVGRKLANYLKDYKAIMKVLLKELSDQTKFAMLPHVHKKSNYKIISILLWSHRNSRGTRT